MAIQSTFNKIPISNSHLNKINLPFALTITPFKNINDLKIKEDFEKCMNCHAFINKFSTSQCNICNEPVNFSVDGEKNFRIELCKQKNKFAKIICIEFTLKSVETGFFKKIISRIKDEDALIFLYSDEVVFPYYAKGEFLCAKMREEIFFPKNLLENYAHDEIIKNLENLTTEKNLINFYLLFKIILSVGENYAGGEIMHYSCSHKIPNINFDYFIEEFNEKNFTYNLYEDRPVESSLVKLVYATNGNYNYAPHDALKKYFCIKIDVKTSDGFRRQNIYADMMDSPSVSAFLPAMNEDDSISISYAFDEIFKENQAKYFQVQVNYAHENGKGILIFNHEIHATHNFREVYNSLNHASLFKTYYQYIIEESSRDRLKSVEENIKKSILFYNKAYGKGGNLEVPKQLHDLLQILLCMHKNRHFQKLNRPVLHKFAKREPELLILHNRPLLYKLSDICINNYAMQKLKYESLHDDEIFILCDGENIFFFLTRKTDEKIFAEEEVEQVIGNFIEEMEKKFMRKLNCHYVKEGEKSEQEKIFFENLVEDGICGLKKFDEYIKNYFSYLFPFNRKKILKKG